MSAQEESVPQEAPQTFAGTPLFPDQLVAGIRISHPAEQQLIKGTVTRLYLFPPEAPKWVYGDLSGEDVVITFRCPVNRAPTTEGQHVVLSGFISVKPSKIHDGLQIQLDGVTVGTWTPNYTPGTIIRSERMQARLGLRDFIRQHGLGKLLVLSTPRGESDYKTPIRSHNLKELWANETCNFGDPPKFLSEMHHAIAQHLPAALAFIRGGSDTSRTLNMWDNAEVINQIINLKLPFYSAIGHSDRLMLIDKHADESFATPTDFGHRLIQAVLGYQQEQNLHEENERLHSECLLLRQKTKEQEHLASIAKSRFRKWAISLLLISTGLAIALSFTLIGWSNIVKALR